jgi:hypothetical protein
MRFAVGFALMAGFCHAAPVPRLTLAEMVESSDYIVEGAVLRSWADWDAAHRLIWTHYELTVRDWLKAPTAGKRTIVVSEPGGTVDGVTIRVPGAAPYSPGEEVVVFACWEPPGYLRTAGDGQGKFTVTGFAGLRGRRVRRGDGVVQMLRDARDDDERLDGAPLDEFKYWIRRALAERRTAR